MAKNLGLHLSIDECMYCGVLYTFVSNKDAHGGRRAVVSPSCQGQAGGGRWFLLLVRDKRAEGGAFSFLSGTSGRRVMLSPSCQAGAGFEV